MIGHIAPEWMLAVAIAAAGWRLRPRRGRPTPQRSQPEPDDDLLVSAESTDANPSSTSARTAPARARSARRWPFRRRVVDATEAGVWCDGIARCLRGGATLASAIIAAPRSPAIEAAAGTAILQLQRGATTIDTLDRIHREATSSHLVLVATVLRTLAVHGGPAAEPVDRAASVLRQRAAAEADRITHSAQARMSARVMTLLPLMMLAIVSVTSTSVRSALATSLGVFTVILGLSFNLVGWWWMNRIITGASR